MTTYHKCAACGEKFETSVERDLHFVTCGVGKRTDGYVHGERADMYVHWIDPETGKLRSRPYIVAPKDGQS